MNPNSLLVQWAEGMTTVTDSAAVAAAGGLVRRAFYSVADVTTEAAAQAMGTQELARLQAGESIVAEPVVDVGTAAAPYSGWYVGDKIPVSGWDSGTDTVPVTGITVTEDDNGVVRGCLSCNHRYRCVRRTTHASYGEHSRASPMTP